MRRYLNVVFLAAILCIVSFSTSPTHAQSTIITLDNVTDLKPIGWLSQGNLAHVAWSPNGDHVAFSTSRGVWLYDAKDFFQPPRRLANQNFPYATQAAFSTNGDLLYVTTGGLESELHIWDVQSGQPVGEVKTGLVHVEAFALSPDGNYLAVAGAGLDQVALLDAKSHRKLDGFGEEYSTRYEQDIVFSPDSKYVLVKPQYYPLRIWSVANGKLENLREITPKRQVSRMAISSDGKHLLLGGRSVIEVWDFAKQERIGQLPTHIVPGDPPFIFSPDGKVLAVASGGERLIQFWDTSGEFATWEVRTTIRIAEEGTPIRGIPLSFAFSPDSQQLVVAKGGAATLWDVNTGKLVASVGSFGDVDRVFAARYTADGKQIVLHVRTPTGYGVTRWDTHTLQRIDQIELPRRAGLSLAVNSDGTKLAVTDNERRQVFLHDTVTGKTIRPYTASNRIMLADFSSDDQTLLLVGNNTTLYRYEITTGKVTSQKIELDSVAPNLKIWQAARSRDGKYLAIQAVESSFKVNRVLVWDVRADKLLPLSIEQQRILPSRFAFSLDNSLLAVIEPHNMFSIYDVQTGSLIMQTDNKQTGVQQLMFSQDQSMLAVLTDKALQFWDIQRGTKIHEIGDVSAGAFSPDYTQLLLVSSDGGATLWGLP